MHDLLVHELEARCVRRRLGAEGGYAFPAGRLACPTAPTVPAAAEIRFRARRAANSKES